MSDPYSNILEMDINDLNGFRDVEAYRKTWYEWCTEYHPLTEDMYRALTDSEQQEISRGRPVIWATYGGLRLISRGIASDAQQAIEDLSNYAAARAATKARKESGWMDNTSKPEDQRAYLTAPNGSTRAGNGQHFDIYAPAHAHVNDPGMWNGRFVL